MPELPPKKPAVIARPSGAPGNPLLYNYTKSGPSADPRVLLLYLPNAGEVV